VSGRLASATAVDAPHGGRLRFGVHGGDAQVRLERSIVIGRPCAEVFAFVSDPANLPSWQPSVLEVARSDGPIGVGSTFTETRHLGPLHTTATVEVTAFEQDRTLDLRATGGPMPVEIRHAFAEAAGTTTLTLTVEASPRGAMRLAAGAIAKTVEHTAEADLARLKALLERSASAAG